MPFAPLIKPGDEVPALLPPRRMPALVPSPARGWGLVSLFTSSLPGFLAGFSIQNTRQLFPSPCFWGKRARVPTSSRVGLEAMPGARLPLGFWALGLGSGLGAVPFGLLLSKPLSLCARNSAVPVVLFLFFAE